MPELAEVEFYRKQWNSGLKQKILSVHVNEGKRVFRGTDAKALQQTLTGATVLESWTHGKQMLFRFSKEGWLGVHLGMTGKLSSEKSDYAATKHDHLILRQKDQTLVFHDPRQFGRILFHSGKNQPAWWANLPTSLLSKEFSIESLVHFLQRHGKAPMKAVLLLQKGFPGVGNWMADEILWQAKIHPKTAARKIDPAGVKRLYNKTQFICQEAMRIIGHDFSDPPKTWLFQYRWEKGGECPRCHAALQHATIGGRTTCWCPTCQPVVK